MQLSEQPSSPNWPQFVMHIDDSLHGLAAQYVASPQWIKTLIGGTYALVPPAARHGPAYRRFLRVFGAAGVDPAYVNERLCETLTEALVHAPAYASFRALAERVPTAPGEVLAQLPTTGKEDIKQALDQYHSQRFGPSARLRMFTGGSTSVPMAFHVHRGVTRAKEWAAFHAMGQRFGTEGQGVILALRGRTVSSAGEGRVWMYEPIKRHLVLSSDHLEPRYMPEYVEALRRWRPRHIHAFPSALFPLIAWLRNNGQEALLSQVSSVLLTSESVFEDHMRAFQSFFECPVMVSYGHTERVLLANTLPGDTRYHFWPHYGHLELLRSDGSAVTREGEVGEIVGTSFDNLVMPFVRYRTGDYAALGAAPNTAAPGFPVLNRIEGRVQEFVVCRDRRLVTVTTLGAAHFQQLDRCLRIQYEQSAPGELVLRVVAMKPLDEIAKREIEQAVRDKTQGGCTVQLQQVDRIELTQRGKQRLLVQHLDVSRYLGAAMNDPLKWIAPAPAPAVGVHSSVNASGTRDATTLLHLPPGRSVMMLGTDHRAAGGIAAVLATYRSGGLFERVPITLIATHVDGSRLRKMMQFAVASLATLRELRARRAVLVHAHVSSRGSFWRKSVLLWLARRFGVPTVFHLHSGGFAKWAAQRDVLTSLRRWSVRRTLESSDRVIVLTRSWAQWMQEFAPAARVNVVGNPVEVPPLAPDFALRGGDAGSGRVLYLGWIAEPKGVFDLLRAWPGFRERFPGWRLAVGGNGQVDAFLALAERLGVREDVDYLGWVSGEAKLRELRRADIFALPSYYEGMPVSVLEAMAHGAAVLTTPVGGIPDMMKPRTHGLWVTPGNVDEIRDSLVELAASTTLRRDLASAAYAHVSSNYGLDASMEPLLKLYTELARKA